MRYNETPMKGIIMYKYNPFDLHHELIENLHYTDARHAPLIKAIYRKAVISVAIIAVTAVALNVYITKK
jgi:hypothetical protein